MRENAGSSGRAKTAIASLLRSLSAQGDASTAPRLEAAAVTDTGTGTREGSGSGAHPPCGCFQTAAPELELERLRRERDEAVRQEQAALRRERDAAVAEAERRGAELDATARELAALREAHAVAALKAKQAAAALTTDVASKAAALERALAANAELTAAGAQQKLRIEALETKQAVLLECFQAMEAELLQLCHKRSTSAARGWVPPLQLPAPSGPALSPRTGSNALALASEPRGSNVCAWDEDGHGSSPLLSAPHMAMAARCAELQWQLSQQRRQADAARSAAAAAEEHAAGLRLLLARQAGADGSTGLGSAASTAALEQRLEAACGQLEEARQAEAELRHLLTQASGSVDMGGEDEQPRRL